MSILALLFAAAPPEGPPSEALERARACIEALDYACAEQELAKARVSVGAERSARAREVWLLGAEVALATERWTDAEEALIQLLLRDPGFAPSPGAWPPPWQEVLARARTRLPDRRPPEIRDIERPELVREGEPFEVRATIRDDRGVAQASLRVSDPPLELAMRARGEQFVALIPGEAVRPPRIELELIAVDEAGNASAPSPELVRVEAEEHISPWIWGAIGVAAIGASVAIGVGLASPDDSGVVSARVSWPRP